MKGYNKILLILIFSIISVNTGCCEFNIFQYRKVIVEEFENRGEERYDYLGDSISNLLYTYALSLPFLTLTDEERAFLKGLSQKPEYKDAFDEAKGIIQYRIEPYILKGIYDKKDFPLYIYGHYNVHSEDKVILNIFVYNSITDKIYVKYKTETNLFTILNNPNEYSIPFFKKFLKYKTYSVSLSAEPNDSLIFIDNKLTGIGKVQDILLAPGYHRVRVAREGYKDYSDLVHIERDGFLSSILLKKEEVSRPILTTVTPSDAQVFANEKYIGNTPFLLSFSESDHTFTFVKEGYIPRTVTVEELSQKEEELHLTLLSTEMKEKLFEKAEIHRKRSEILSYTGIGMLGLSVLLGIEGTANTQLADLYTGKDEDRYNQAVMAANIFNYLSTASSIITGGIFIFSFIELLRYFTLYNYHESLDYGKEKDLISLLRGGLRF